MILPAALALAVVALAAAAFALRNARRDRAELERARARLARIDAALVPGDAEETARAESLQRDVRVSIETRELAHDRSVLVALLADIRDLTGAQEAIFWRWSADRDALAPDSWSSDGARPAHFDVTLWGPLVQWAAETRGVQTVGPDDAVQVAAACVTHGERLLGVLSVTHAERLAFDRPTARGWLPRLAAQVATFQELVDVRRRSGRHMRQSQALLDAVQRLQGHRSGDGLARALCETALDVSGARGAALIRWDPEADAGEICHASDGTGLRLPATLAGESVAADVCRSGKPHVLEDARGAASGEALYGVPRVIREPAAVALLPLLRDGRVLGALVLESDEPGALTLDDARPLTVLGAVAAGSLEMAWQFAEVDRKARTDALTGLWNRVHFGEQLQRKLAEADRYGHPVSLVLVDVDHFKSVNDRWGHEAGDAVLKQVARVLQDGVRAVDVCVRYGGEEIAMLLSQTESARAVEVAERLRARIAASPVRFGGAEITVTASFGVAAYPETVRVRDHLFPAADKALYIAKHDGRNCVRAKPASRGQRAS